MHQTGRRQRDSQAAFLFPGPLAIFFLELQKHPSLEIKQDIKKNFFKLLNSLTTDQNHMHTGTRTLNYQTKVHNHEPLRAIQLPTK